MYNRPWLSALREENKITLTALAKRMGVSRQAVHGWESGQQCPDRDKVFLLSDILGPEVLTHFAAEARAKQDGRVA